MPQTITHGTHNAYVNHGCRCDDCRAASSKYRRRRGPAPVDREALRDLLTELFPHGLTADCPAAARRP